MINDSGKQTAIMGCFGFPEDVRYKENVDTVQFYIAEHGISLPGRDAAKQFASQETRCSAYECMQVRIFSQEIFEMYFNISFLKI